MVITTIVVAIVSIVTILLGHGGFVMSAAFSPDGEVVVTASADWTAKLWCSTAGECLRTLEGHTNLLNCASFSPV